MYKNGEAVEDVESPHDGLQSFVEFIKKQSEGNEGGRADLAAHNAFNFDHPTLLKQFKDFNCKDWEISIRYEYEIIWINSHF